jgi:hypothetical protein
LPVAAKKHSLTEPKDDGLRSNDNPQVVDAMELGRNDIQGQKNART